MPTTPVNTKKNTNKNTNYGVKKFQAWWADMISRNAMDFDPAKFPNPAQTATFIEADDFVQAFLLMSEVQRAAVMRHFVRTVPRSADGKLLRTTTIKNILDAVVRAVQLVEAQDEVLYAKYGDWSWSKRSNLVFKIVRDELKDRCIELEKNVQPNTFRRQTSSDIMR